MARLAPRTCPILIGRDSELATGAQLLVEAAAGHGRFALISGEAGIGKSRLAHAFGNAATRDGFARLTGVCGEHDRAYPFAPLLDAVRQHLRHAGTSGATRLFGADYAAFTRLLPELPTLDAAPPAPPTSLAPEAEKRRLFEAFVRLFARLTATAPLCVVLEDLHWADETTLELLQVLPRRLADARVLVVLTARNDEPGDAVTHWRGYLERHHLVTPLDLAPLTQGEVEGVIAATVGDVPAGVTAAIGERAEGNPFYVEELLHAWAEPGEAGEARFVPASVRETVTHRLDALGEGVRTVAEAAAVIGRRFAFRTLRAVTGVNERALATIIRAMVGAYLVIEEEGGGFAFRHALTRDAIYGRLLVVERQRLHGQVARALAGDAAAGVPVPAGELGYHHHAAREWEAALRWCREAGDGAIALYAPHAAIEHFTRAIEAADALGVSAISLVAARGTAYRLRGDAASAQGDFARALAEARQSGDDAAVMGVLIELGYLWSTNDAARSRRYYEEAAALARTGEDAAATAHILSRLGYLFLFADQPAEAEPYAREALAIARDRDDRREIALALQMIGTAAMLNADLVRAAQYNRAAAAGFAAVGDRVSHASALSHLSQESATLHVDWAVPAAVSLAVGVANAEQALAITRASGSSFMESQAPAMLAAALGAQGVYGPALIHARHAVRSAVTVENRQQGLFAHNVLSLISRDLLALPHAIRQLERALALARELGAPFYIRHMAARLASVLVEAGEITRAELLLAEMLAPDTPSETLVQRRLWLARAELALAGGEPELVLRIVDNLIATAFNIGDLGDRGIPRVSLLRGQALAALGRTAEAEAALTAAAETAEAQGARPLLWRIHRALGLMHQAAGDPANAAAAFDVMQAIVAALAESVPDERLRVAFVRGVAASVPAPHRRTTRATRATAKAQDDGLTRRERDVVAQVARGVDNREIAAALFVTKKTVENHLTRILRKLRLRTRTDLITWADAQGITPPPAPGTLTSA